MKASNSRAPSSRKTAAKIATANFITLQSIHCIASVQGEILEKIFGTMHLNRKCRWLENRGASGETMGRGLGIVMSSQRDPGRIPGRKHILAYFVGHRTVLFAPICRCFEFVKRFFMSHFTERRRFGEHLRQRT